MTDPKEKLIKRLYPSPVRKSRKDRNAKIEASLCVRFDPDMGFRLSIIRRQMGFKQGDLAKRLGLSRQAIQKIESGKTAVTNISYLQLRSTLDRPGKNFLNFLFMGPPKSKWLEFIRFTSLRQAGMKMVGTASEIVNDYEMI